MTASVEGALERLRMQESSVPGADETLTIAEVAERTGVTAHTLRYYERVGLVQPGRDPAGHRVYSASAFGRVVFLNRMRMTGMPIRELQRYVALVEAGEHTVPARLDIMQEHRDAVRQQIAELQFSLETIEFKIAVYGGQLG